MNAENIVLLLLMLKNRIYILVTMAFLSVIPAYAQVNQQIAPEDREVDMDNPTFEPMVKVGKVLMGSDSIQYVELNKIWVYPPIEFKNAKERIAYNRLVANVKKVLPIAKEVNQIIIETYEYLQTLPNKKAKDEHMKLVEKSIKKEYTPRMKKLTYSQGKLLIKLVYRECNSSSYSLIQAFLGPIRAGFYQAFASLFGASLTKKYDANGVDRLTERVVRQVEAGQL
ncbi:conserved hypothetical protein [Segatella baroniae B14]|uniref:DUF4294 domain-containing protein n=3 Tax=Segatella TaxID=2974251 RepID=D8DZT9_9BACT|nr:conserved hypothetical protein [Segatella baroniae B14]